MDQEKIGKFIAACRREQNLTQAQLAEQLGITNRAVSKWENARSVPDVSIMVTICVAVPIYRFVLPIFYGNNLVKIDAYNRIIPDVRECPLSIASTFSDS